MIKLTSLFNFHLHPLPPVPIINWNAMTKQHFFCYLNVIMIAMFSTYGIYCQVGPQYWHVQQVNGMVNCYPMFRNIG